MNERGWVSMGSEGSSEVDGIQTVELFKEINEGVEPMGAE